MTWQLIVSTHTESESFRAEWDKAVQVQKLVEESSELPDWEVSTRVLASSQCMETITTRFAFVTLSEFWKLFQMEPRTMGLKVYTKRVKFGREMQGVLVRPSAMSASVDCRELTLSTSTACTLEEALVSDDNRLREAQPSDTWSFLNAGNAQNLDCHVPSRMYQTTLVEVTHVRTQTTVLMCPARSAVQPEQRQQL